MPKSIRKHPPVTRRGQKSTPGEVAARADSGAAEVGRPTLPLDGLSFRERLLAHFQAARDAALDALTRPPR